MEKYFYSHVLYFPSCKPFDRGTQNEAFVGEFVKPLMKDRNELYWFSFYGSFARFRVYTSEYEKFKTVLEARRDSFGLIDKGEEKEDFILEKALGQSRFLAPDSRSNSPRRAELVLRYLHSICKLYEDNLVQEEDGYWRLERSTDTENPLGNNFESLAHLLGNISQFQFDVEFGYRTPWMHPHPIQKFRCHL